MGLLTFSLNVTLDGCPDPSRLRAAIERVLVEDAFRRNARKIADEIAALPTLDRAVAALLAVGGGRPS